MRRTLPHGRNSSTDAGYVSIDAIIAIALLLVFMAFSAGLLHTAAKTASVTSEKTEAIIDDMRATINALPSQYGYE